MRTLLKFAIVAAFVGWGCVALLRAQAHAPSHQPDTDHEQWVQMCLKDFDSIKVGMTRGQIEGILSKDGGLQSASLVRFAHPACASFKMDVEFDFKRNAADQNRAVRSEDDKATKVSKPYIERPVIDWIHQWRTIPLQAKTRMAGIVSSTPRSHSFAVLNASSMSSLSLRLPDSLHRQLKQAAEADGISVNQFISLAVAEKLSALQTYDIIAERAKRSSRSAFLQAMSLVPKGEVQEGDELP